MCEGDKIEQLTIPQILSYHLSPGIPILIIATVLSNPLWGINLPFLLSLFLAIVFGLIPTEMLILLVTAKRQGKQIRAMISNTEKISIVQMIIWTLVPFLILGFVFSVVPELEQPLWTVFNWVPDWFRISLETVKQQPAMIWPVIWLGFIFNGFLGPIVEELYFRGFLLPRMKNLGKLAPLVNVVLFSLYHLFSPWENITRILSALPYVYAVWYKKNIHIGMIVHCSGNLIGLIGTAIALLS